MVLAAVLVAAGISKVGRSRGVLDTFENFGVPFFLRRRIVAILFPVLEIALGVLLVTMTGAIWVLTGWVSAAVTAAFLFVTTRAFSRGERIDCGCFGAHRTPISISIVVRNSLLFLAAAGTTVMASAGLDSVPATLADFDTHDWTWSAAALFLAGITAAFFSSLRGSSDVAPGMQNRALTGTVLPDLYLSTIGQEPVRLHDMLKERPRLLLLVRPGCPSCDVLLHDPRPLHDALDPTIELVLIVSGAEDAFRTAHPELAEVALFGGWPLAEHLRVSAFPGAVLVGAGGSILAEPVAGRPAILDLSARSSSLLHRRPRTRNS
ncbi:MauE/DoxX family redox-associated membrane protein [Microbacterium sp.]|uniref:MauE/DoxX family redox-associated membrane protein n=1 Tax=Microbacterium sp. TaxID=51671 RepID=UPI003A9009D5